MLAVARSDVALTLGIAAGGALVVWLVLVAVLAAATRAKEPEAVAAGLEVGGDEPPAVVNLLTNGWKVRGEALTATLVDLAARGAVLFHDDSSGGGFVVELQPTDESLTDYERRVLDLVRQRAHDGAVPAAALTCGTESETQRLHRSFTKEVIADARRRGLSRPRWGKAVTALVSAVALAPALLAAGAVAALPDAHQSSKSHDNPIGAFIGVAIFTWGMLLAFFGWLRAERETAEGLAHAGRWLGLRTNLDADGTFPDLPPTAVAIWDRYLAYAVALGVAVTTERAFPLGAESDHEAWSAQSGAWRLVRVRYPQRLPPGWGRPPWQVAVAGLCNVAVASGLAFFVLPAAYDAVGDNQQAERAVGAVLAVVAVVLALVTARGLWMLVTGVADIGRGRSVEGLVLRVRSKNKRSYVAIDDGTDDHVRAFVNARAGAPTQGTHVRATVAPHVGYIRTCAPVAVRSAVPPSPPTGRPPTELRRTTPS